MASIQGLEQKYKTFLGLTNGEHYVPFSDLENTHPDQDIQQGELSYV